MIDGSGERKSLEDHIFLQVLLDIIQNIEPCAALSLEGKEHASGKVKENNTRQR